MSHAHAPSRPIAPPSSRGLVASLVETTKPAIVRLVTITSMVGFALAAAPLRWATRELVFSALVCMLGTALSAAGANAINQWMERDRDACMRRTCGRPLPQQRVTPNAVLFIGILLSILGVGLLLVLPTHWPATLSAICVLVYVLAYTPLKPRTTLSTLVGAIPGALPPLIGWTAVSNDPTLAVFDPVGSVSGSGGAWGGLILFSLMFVWQMPHFLAIAWMYRDDYEKGGYRVLPVLDPTGERTSRAIALWTALLIPITLAPIVLMPTYVSWPYGLVALITGGVFAKRAWTLCKTRDRADARSLFIGSVIQLPILLVALVVESLLRVALA